MHDRILEKLDRIERDHNVAIILACESGSRAWGFPSADSDYDVRFVYAHPVQWYLSIDPGRDVIETPVDPVFDVNGWDVRKALQLLRKSNATLLEWLSSPIRYCCRDDLLKPILDVVPLGFQQHAAAKHYLAMAKSNIAKTHGGNVRMKRYLYAVRPLLCCRWVLDRKSQPPMLFRDLVAEYIADTDVGNEISAMIDIKERNSECDTVQSNEVLNTFIESEFDALSSRLPDDDRLPNAAPFDSAFRQIISGV